jgi:hypothetical protein
MYIHFWSQEYSIQLKIAYTCSIQRVLSFYTQLIPFQFQSQFFEIALGQVYGMVDDFMLPSQEREFLDEILLIKKL